MISNLKDIEELSLNHWPALHTKELDGWKLRTANGYTKRANSVSTLIHSDKNILAMITQCEHHYQSLQQPTIFKLTPFSEPKLDEVLEQLQYSKIEPSCMMMMSLDEFQEVKMPNVEVTDELAFTLLHHISIKWIEEYCTISHVNQQLIPTIIDMLAAVQGELVCCSCRLNGEVVAVGLAVIENGYISLYNIVTEEKYRNKGVASALITKLLQFGIQKGAISSYLAVLADNEPAKHLYEKLGYREQYPYWYRVKQAEASVFSTHQA